MNSILPGNSIQGLYNPLTVGSQNGQSKTTASEIPFSSLFADAVRNVAEMDAIKQADSLNLAVGDVDDLGAIMVNADRAETALQLLVQLRNKVLDSYSEIMRMNV